MKKTTAKIIQISDLIQWHEKNEIELSPKYQRNSVWNEKAKSYLIDTIVRGLPIPPIFLRQKIDVTTKSTHREIIDGQQRVRTILEFIVSERFSIKRSHNKYFGGKLYSDLDADTQENILGYEILAEVVSEKEESAIYDMFARLNSNNYVLNKQEIRNSKYWGDFKVFAYEMTSKYREFLLHYKILSDNDFARMKDIEWMNSIIIVTINGIVNETPSYVDNIYATYDVKFENSCDIEDKISSIMNIIVMIYDNFNDNLGVFKNKNYLFSLYCVLLNQMYGLDEISNRTDMFNRDNIINNFDIFLNQLSEFISDCDTYTNDTNNIHGLYHEFSTFANHHKTRTTSKIERIDRIEFLNNYLGSVENDE